LPALENRVLIVDENEDGPMPQEQSGNLLFFLVSFGLLALLVGSGIVVASVTI
jgi:hypothetical protein